MNKTCERHEVREHHGIKYEVLLKWHPIHNRYRLLRDYTTQTALLGYDIFIRYLMLTPDGLLLIREGYEWDGPSGWTWDTYPFIRPSLGHDGKYQLMRMGLLPQRCRYQVDFEMRRDAEEDRMFLPRQKWTFVGVRYGAAFAAKVTEKI